MNNTENISEQKTQQWVDINYIQKNILPLSKKKIHDILKKNCDVTYAGNKMVVEPEQLLAFLRKEY